MSLANFFDRTEQALNYAIRAIDPEILRDYLADKAVGIIFDDDSLKYKNNVIIMELSVNLFSRMYHKIGIFHNGSMNKGVEKVNDLITIAKQINPNIELVENLSDLKSKICIRDIKSQSGTCIYPPVLG